MKVCIKNPKPGMTKSQIEVISSFIKFLQSQLPLSSEIELVLTNTIKDTVTTGVRMPGSKIYVLSKGRMLVDILRTLSHEWVHEFQYQKMGLDDNTKIKDIGGPEENMSNILSGIFIKKFDKQNPDYKDTLYESMITEISIDSAGVDKLINIFSKKPELLKHLDFRNIDAVKYFIDGASYDDFNELKDDVKEFLKQRENYFQKEMDEIERAVQDLSRNGDIETTVKDVISAFRNTSEVDLTKDIWSKLENTESNEIKKGELEKVVTLAKKYNKSSPLKLKKSLLQGDYGRPMILKFGDRYHLVAGNTRLSTAAALGITPKVLIAEI